MAREINPSMRLVLYGILAGHDNMTIARDTRMNIQTVKDNVTKLLKRTGTKTRAQLIVLYYQAYIGLNILHSGDQQ